MDFFLIKLGNNHIVHKQFAVFSSLIFLFCCILPMTTGRMLRDVRSPQASVFSAFSDSTAVHSDVTGEEHQVLHDENEAMNMDVDNSSQPMSDTSSAGGLLNHTNFPVCSSCHNSFNISLV